VCNNYPLNLWYLLLEAIVFSCCSCGNSYTNIVRVLFRCLYQCYINLYNISNSVTVGSVQHKQLYIYKACYSFKLGSGYVQKVASFFEDFYCNKNFVLIYSCFNMWFNL